MDVDKQKQTVVIHHNLLKQKTFKATCVVPNMLELSYNVQFNHFNEFIHVTHIHTVFTITFSSYILFTPACIVFWEVF